MPIHIESKKMELKKFYRFPILCERLEKLVGDPGHELEANKLSEIVLVLKDIKAREKQRGNAFRENVKLINNILSSIENANPEDISELEKLKSLLINLLDEYRVLTRTFRRVNKRKKRKSLKSLMREISERQGVSISTPSTQRVKDKIRMNHRISKNLKK